MSSSIIKGKLELHRKLTMISRQTSQLQHQANLHRIPTNMQCIPLIKLTSHQPKAFKDIL